MQVRTGVDLGGTKIEAVVLAQDDRVIARQRCATPKDDYSATVNAVVALIEATEREAQCSADYVGLGAPGSPAPMTGLQRNANSTALNGQPLAADVSEALGRPIVLANDADCLALSEAHDGAGAGHQCVFAVILGTGIGGGLVLGGKLHRGPNGLGGELGHTALPRPSIEETPGPECYCGKHGCIEAWLSGPAVAAQWADLGHPPISPTELATKQMLDTHRDAVEVIENWFNRLARALANTITVLDPDVIVFGGGMSAMPSLTQELKKRLPELVFGGLCRTALALAQHGDSSGVLGAARLPLTDLEG